MIPSTLMLHMSSSFTKVLSWLACLRLRLAQRFHTNYVRWLVFLAFSWSLSLAAPPLPSARRFWNYLPWLLFFLSSFLVTLSLLTWPFIFSGLRPLSVAEFHYITLPRHNYFWYFQGISLFLLSSSRKAYFKFSFSIYFCNAYRLIPHAPDTFPHILLWYDKVIAFFISSVELILLYMIYWLILASDWLPKFIWYFHAIHPFQLSSISPSHNFIRHPTPPISAHAHWWYFFECWLYSSASNNGDMFSDILL